MKSPFFDAPIFDVLGCKSRFSVKKLAISAILEKQDKGSKSKSRKVRIQLTLDSSLKGLQRLIQLRGMGRIGKWTPLFERQSKGRRRGERKMKRQLLEEGFFSGICFDRIRISVHFPLLSQVSYKQLIRSMRRILGFERRSAD